MNYRTINDLSSLIRANLHRIPKVDVIAGIPRSGMLAASMIATLTDQPLANVRELITNSWRKSVHGGRWIGCRCHRVLLVDDSISGGETLKRVLSDLPHYEVTTLAVFRKPDSPAVDISFETVPGPRVFEWNWFRHPYVKSAVLDIDGVICTPTIPYARSQGLPLYLPKYPVLAIATGRWEEERKVTEMWLADHKVRYGKLFMSSPEQSGRVTKLKAAIETGAKWIVESNERQAAWLHEQSNRPVLCVDTNRMF